MNPTDSSLENSSRGVLGEQSIGQIAVELPGATAVFRRLKLDFCCAGQVALRQACRDKGLSLDAVLADLAELERPAVQPQQAASAELIDHILERYHAVHRVQLPELIRLARRVEAVHRDHPAAPLGLAEHLVAMETELLDHMAKEENILFPMLKSGSGMARQPILMMRHEHVSHGEQLQRLQALTNDATPPADACNTWRALYSGIAALSADLVSHIHMENNVLFPRFELGDRAARG